MKDVFDVICPKKHITPLLEIYKKCQGHSESTLMALFQTIKMYMSLVSWWHFVFSFRKKKFDIKRDEILYTYIHTYICIYIYIYIYNILFVKETWDKKSRRVRFF